MQGKGRWRTFAITQLKTTDLCELLTLSVDPCVEIWSRWALDVSAIRRGERKQLAGRRFLLPGWRPILEFGTMCESEDEDVEHLTKPPGRAPLSPGGCSAWSRLFCGRPAGASTAAPLDRANADVMGGSPSQKIVLYARTRKRWVQLLTD